MVPFDNKILKKKMMLADTKNDYQMKSFTAVLILTEQLGQNFIQRCF